MATTTTTLLQAVNRVLVDAGERPVNNINNFTAQKVVSAFATALDKLSSMRDWGFMRETTNAVSWANNVATLPDVHKLFSVSVHAGKLVTVLQPVERDVFPWQQLVVGVPRIYHQVNESEVIFYPYPNTTSERQAVLFSYLKPLVMPTTNDGVFPIPQRFMETLHIGATAKFVHNQLDDGAGASQIEQEFFSMGRSHARRETSTTANSMFKSRSGNQWH